ncbi:MAG: hypothetical protein M3Z24_15760, partial [Chloroflexota bacterium]|nr:hypothetical protein [Chloroflexota bacterium]
SYLSESFFGNEVLTQCESHFTIVSEEALIEVSHLPFQNALSDVVFFSTVLEHILTVPFHMLKAYLLQ